MRKPSKTEDPDDTAESGTPLPESGVHPVAAAPAPMPAADRHTIHGALDELLAAWAAGRQPSRYWADVRAASYELAEGRQDRASSMPREFPKRYP